MAQVIVRHKVKDYSAWKSVFDGFANNRRTGGEKSYRIYHPDDDPKNIFVIVEYDSLNNAKNFLGSSELKQAMRDSGVVDQPDIYYLEEYDSGTT